MDRADRLLTLVAELRRSAPHPVNAAALAGRLTVSERTVRRDLSVLIRAGLPVRVERGRGYALAEDPPRRRLTEATSLIGPVRDTLAEAVHGHRVVRLAYTDRSGQRTRRDVEAHGLVTAPYGDYLVGWCRMREAPRMFRVDRIGAAFVTTREAGLRDLDSLLAALRVPEPRPPDGPGPGRARAWTLARIRAVRGRLGDTLSEVAGGAARSGREGAAELRTVVGHLAEWTRWQTAAARAAATGDDLRFDGRRPGYPAGFEGELPFAGRERMIQDAMAMRSLGEMARDLDGVLGAAARWAAGCRDDLWLEAPPDPGDPGRHRPLADLLAGWRSPLAHIEWHLDRLADDPGPGPQDDEGVRVVERCPFRA